MIAVGLGCRTGCDAHVIVQAIDRALWAVDKTRADACALFAPDFKHAERGLAAAAEQLQKPLLLLSMAQLRAQAARALTHSVQVQQRFGLPSIAETAALAGAATFSSRAVQPRLLAPRERFAQATCALAMLEDMTVNLTEPAT